MNHIEKTYGGKDGLTENEFKKQIKRCYFEKNGI